MGYLPLIEIKIINIFLLFVTYSELTRMVLMQHKTLMRTAADGFKIVMLLDNFQRDEVR